MGRAGDEMNYTPGDQVETPNGEATVIFMTYYDQTGAINRDMDAVIVRHKRSAVIRPGEWIIKHNRASGAAVVYRLKDVRPVNGIGI